METHLMTDDLLAACDAEDIAAGRTPANRYPKGTFMVPSSMAREVTCARCLTWVHA